MDVFRVAPDGANEGFDDGADLSTSDGPIIGDGLLWVPIDKGHLQVDLSEFWLTVFSSVFVAETACELKVARDGA